jgi:hypothetical protein
MLAKWGKLTYITGLDFAENAIKRCKEAEKLWKSLILTQDCYIIIQAWETVNVILKSFQLLLVNDN